MVFCNREEFYNSLNDKLVTILILIDGFLQYEIADLRIKNGESHNPYFNRWFSAITNIKEIDIMAIKSQSLF